MNRIEKKLKARAGRKVHIRKRISGSTARPRLCIYKSNMRLYVQAIDDVSGHTLVAASTLEKDLKDVKPNVAGGEKLGAVMGERLKSKGITTVVFDRNGYKYHGVVKALADAVRKAGLEF
ncbi:50S ribosomal protein L18 [Entomospira nematocerorum]|uniref:Large ribosomal subunit protein uL18 n=2 Tax=Entomospira TaxID=2834378 RepID=A0A968GHJ1_9SPIO|nr:MULTISPECIES: 50S ribosomal protein L18 [Entomospira]NIZ40238.1 50S ribosomal protein L18 [Entomospira entomophilus]NIZ47256.1 50S ribosomal protein L18 [Entomospira nematocera]WDI34202.1 50S ribosomal protein L18 [Entomospira nematocera]WDI35797.1 50S ribosomal protein L18 [Entomospira entomophilus]